MKKNRTVLKLTLKEIKEYITHNLILIEMRKEELENAKGQIEYLQLENERLLAAIDPFKRKALKQLIDYGSNYI